MGDFGDWAEGVASGGIAPAYDVVNDATGNKLNDITGLGTSTAERAARANAQTWAGLTPPQIAALQDYSKVKPATSFVSKQADSSLGKYQNDPAVMAAQMAALQRLQEVGAGGLTMADKAALDTANRQQDASARGQREAIMQNQAARGLSGSGNELAALLSADQGNANAKANSGANAVNAAQSRALDAIINGGNLSGNIINQQFGQAQSKASAQDAINAFNAGNLTNAGAADYNRQLANVDIANQNKVQRPLSQYDLERQHVADVTGAKTAQANAAMNSAGILGQNLQTAASAIAGAPIGGTPAMGKALPNKMGAVDTTTTPLARRNSFVV